MTVQTLERELKPLEPTGKSEFKEWLFATFPPGPIKSAKLHKNYLEMVEKLTVALTDDDIRAREKSDIREFLEVVTPFVEEFEKRNSPPSKPVTPEEMLAFLMDQNKTRQRDIADLLGGQSVVSEIRRGKRKLRIEHIQRLVDYFGVSIETFFPQPSGVHFIGKRSRRTSKVEVLVNKAHIGGVQEIKKSQGKTVVSSRHGSAKG